MLRAPLGLAALLASGSPALGLPLADPIPASIPKSVLAIELDTIADGLDAPDFLADPGDGSGRLFVVEQTGQIRLIQNGALAPAPFLDLSAQLVPNLLLAVDERGLLGLAFHPGFADAASPGHGKFYTYHSAPVGAAADFTVPITGRRMNHQSVVTEWTLDDASADV
ncbi:MAG: hypothetical protein ACREI8_00135, partial [Myxococcota bacterium]